MLIEELIFDILYKKDSLKIINNYIIDEMNENFCDNKEYTKEIRNKIISLLYANSSIIESIENILYLYQEKIDNYYTKLSNNDI